MQFQKQGHSLSTCTKDILTAVSPGKHRPTVLSCAKLQYLALFPGLTFSGMLVIRFCGVEGRCLPADFGGINSSTIADFKLSTV